MAAPSSEVENVQNPALGSLMLWKFGTGFQDEAQFRSASFLLFYVPFAICFHKPTLELLLSTRIGSGLSLFAAKLSESAEELMAVHERALAYRKLTLDSIAMAVRCGLLTVDYKSATARANLVKGPFIRERIKPLLIGSEKLGAWCSRLPLEQVASTLKLEF